MHMLASLDIHIMLLKMHIFNFHQIGTGEQPLRGWALRQSIRTA